MQHQVGVEFVEGGDTVMHRLFELHAEHAHIGVFAGVTLRQQDLQRRLVG